MEKSIKKVPIREQIYNLLKESIIERKYMPGQKLSISSISRDLDVSNSPVREAISMLERDGLVEIYPNAGPSVITFSNEKLIQIAQAILSMLLGAFELCLQTGRTDSLIALLQKALKEQKLHLQAETEQEYVKYSIAFESAFIQCCCNPYITRQYSEIEDLFYLTVLYDHWYIDTVRMQALMEHQQILSAIISGDMDKAKLLLTRHYNRFQEERRDQGELII